MPLEGGEASKENEEGVYRPWGRLLYCRCWRIVAIVVQQMMQEQTIVAIVVQQMMEEHPFVAIVVPVLAQMLTNQPREQLE